MTANPYIGPRAFQTGERLFGRDYETHELLNLLVAQRIVLLHSPSGAGKSSLVNAGLIPRLKEDGFEVLPVIRVNLAPPASTPAGFNRYSYSMLVNLEERLPDEQRRAPAGLASLTLAQYLGEEKAAGRILAESAEHNPPNLALILDQFEEVLTVEPNDVDGKMAFFEQLGEALRDRSIWALFSMREDYLAGLTPYLRPVPTHLSNTYRLDFLDAKAAIQAVRQPAEGVGVAFDEKAAQALVDNLRRVQVQQPDGSVRAELGPSVEPLQMQVICYRLWEGLTPGDTTIDQQDIEKLGDVNRSLSEYYDQQVAEAALASGTSERTIRAWVADNLVTPTGIRGQVLMETGRSKGLDNAAINDLVSAYLLRREVRGGATWYELAHDRLIQPVRESNQAWFDANLSLLQKQAALWDSQGRLPGLLISGKELEQIRAWAANHPDEMSQTDQRFLEACEQAALQAEQERKLVETTRHAEEQARRAEEQAREARRLRQFVALLVIGLIISIILGITAVSQSNLARSQSRTATVALGQVQEQRSTITLALGQVEEQRNTVVVALANANREKETAVSALMTSTAALVQAEQEKALADVKRGEVAAQATQQLIFAATQQSAYLANLATQQVLESQLYLPTRTLLPPTGGGPGNPEDESARLALASQKAVRQPDLSLLLALQAQNTFPSDISRRALYAAIARGLDASRSGMGLLLDNSGPVRSLAFSPRDGRQQTGRNIPAAGNMLAAGNMVAAAAGENLLAWDLSKSFASPGDFSPRPALVKRFAFPAGALERTFFDPSGRIAALLKTEQGISLPTKVEETIEGIEVNGGSGNVDWKQVAQGPSFAFAKATDGAKVFDASFARYWFAMKEAGVLRGAIHIYNFNFTPQDQAAAFLDAVPFQVDDLPPALDLSDTARVVSFIHTEEIASQVLAWLDAVEGATGKTPILILQPTNPAFDVYLTDPAFQRYPLWVMLLSRPEPGRVFAGRRWLFWHYREDFTLGGIENPVGLSTFNGPRADLFALAYRGLVEDLETGKVLYPILSPFADSAVGGSTLILRHPAGELEIVDLNIYQALISPEKLVFPGSDVVMAVSGSGQSIAVAADGELRVFNLGVWQTAPISGLKTSAITFSPDGRQAAVAEAGSRSVFFVALRPIFQQSAPGTSLDVSQSVDFPAQVTALAYSGDGGLLVAGLEDGRIALLDTSGAGILGNYPLKVKSPVTALAFYPTERVLAVGTGGGTLLVDLREDGITRQACALAGREMTVDELRIYELSPNQPPVCK